MDTKNKLNFIKEVYWVLLKIISGLTNKPS